MTLVMPIQNWPASDQALWATLMQPGGPFDDKGALAHLRETSRETLATRYGRWLEWLKRNEPDALLEPPTQRPRIDRLRAWLVALDHTAKMTQLMFIDGVYRVVTAAAPDADWSRHKRFLSALKRLAKGGTSERKRGRILSSRVLLKAGLDLAGPKSQATANALQRALMQRDGTMIALLAMMPMRLRALSELELGTSLHVGEECITVDLSEEMTKTGVHWEANVPEPAVTALRQYLTEVRPFLMARGQQAHARLWVEKKGAPMQKATLRLRIAQTTQNLTGIRIPPHFFRDSAATTLARENTTASRLIRPVLAHSCFETAEKHYIQAQTLDAGRAFTALLQKRKKAGGR